MPTCDNASALPLSSGRYNPASQIQKYTHRRDAIMLVLGAGLLVTTAGLGWKIKRMLGEKQKTGEEQELEKTNELR